jgi:epoxyqueuosine reductase
MKLMILKRTLKERALALGFDFAGVAPISVWDDLNFSRDWVERGYAGEMGYLANPKRDDPRLLLPSVRSVLCVGMIYNAPLPYSTAVPEHGRQMPGQTRTGEGQMPDGAAQPQADAGAKAWISRYAWGRDYHERMRVKLEGLRETIEVLDSGVETRVYVDTGPVVERAFARYSGIGWTGKNTCLINQQKGSWFFIGVVLTNLALDPDLPAPDRCGSCTRCLEACPTGALLKPYVMDASRCIAYFTIELKGSIPVEWRPAIGSNVFGCDICQDVCPWNGKGSRPPSVVRGQSPGSADSSIPTTSRGTPLTACSSPVGREGREGREGLPLRGALSPAGGENPNGESAGPISDTSRELRPAATTNVPEFQPLEVQPAAAKPFSLFNPSLRDLVSITEEDFRRLFAHSPIKRTRYRGWLRNLCVAIGNAGDPAFVPWLEGARQYPDPTVREHAEWALQQLQK